MAVTIPAVATWVLVFLAPGPGAEAPRVTSTVQGYDSTAACKRAGEAGRGAFMCIEGPPSKPTVLVCSMRADEDGATSITCLNGYPSN